MTCSEAVTRSVESLIRAADPLVTCLEAVSSSAESLVRAAEPLVIYFQAVACAVEPCAVEIFFALPMVTGGEHERTAHWNVMANAARTCRLACWPPRKLPPLLGELACVDEDDFGSGTAAWANVSMSHLSQKPWCGGSVLETVIDGNERQKAERRTSIFLRDRLR